MLNNLLYVAIIVIIVLAIALRFAVPYISQEPDNLGVTNGQLASCPSSPNCVSSFAEDEDHAIVPIPFMGSQEETHAALIDVLRSLPRSEIITTDPNYIHMVTRSRLMGYIDDNEFLLDEASGVVHIRAAARLGQSDMGANRARMELIRSAME